MNFPVADYFQMLHSMASLYQIDCSQAFKCFIEASNRMLNNKLHSSPSQPDLQSNHTLLKWTYTLNKNVYSEMYPNTYFMSYDDFLFKYSPENMNITTWSHPTWKMIHYFASKYDNTPEYALSYKAYISCLQYLLPCGKCRGHLRENLMSHPVDEYFGSKEDLFIWSFILHQDVSAQTKSKSISLTEAKRMYKI